MDKTQSFYDHYMSKVSYHSNVAAAHGHPTDLARIKQACNLQQSPFILNCNFDAAGSMFGHIIPHTTPLQPRNYYWQDAGDLIQFWQQEFFPSNDAFVLSSFDEIGYAYVPHSC